MEESFDLMVPGIEKKVPENKEPEIMRNTFKDLGVIIGFIFIYIILYQYVSTGDISNGIDLQNDVDLILSDTQNFSLVPGSVPGSVAASDASSSPGSVPASGSSSSPGSVPASDASSSPGSVPASDASSSPGSVPASGSSSSPGSVPASDASSSPGSVPASDASSSPGSVPASGSSSSPGSVPASGASAPSPAPSSAPSPAPSSAPSPAPSSAPTESPDPIIIKPKIHSIRMDINGFYPDVISINKSDIIIWTNVEDQRPRVVLLSKDGLFKNQVLMDSNRFEYKFFKKGNYSFVLVEHPSLIEYPKAKGNVIVN